MSYLSEGAFADSNCNHAQVRPGQLPGVVVSSLASSFDIDCVTYAQYKDNSVKWFTSNLFYLELFLDDSESLFPVEVADGTSLLPWKSYCSDYFLERCQSEFEYNSDGVTVFLQHDNYAEHISIGTSKKQFDLHKLLYTNPDIKRQIVSHIRCSLHLANLNSLPYVFSKPDLTFKNKKKTPLKREQDLLISTKRHFLVGNRGPTYLTRSEMKCLYLYLQLRTAKEIADLFHFSVKTAEAHLGNIKRKCGAKTKHELYLIALNNLLI